MVRLTLKQCAYFAAVAETGVMAQAARRLNISEPALADAIGKLEEALGLKLLERFHAKGVRLTQEGGYFLLAARRLLQSAEEAEHAALGLARDVAGSLRLGCFQTIAPFVLPALVNHLRSAHPLIEVQPREDQHDALVDGLAGGTLDFALLYAMGVDRGLLETHSVAALRPYAVLPAGHRLAGRKVVGLVDLAQEPVVLFDLPGSAAYFTGLFARSGLQPMIAFRSQSLESVRSAVGNGLGVSVLVMRPPGQRSYDGRRLAAVPLDRTVPSLEVLVAWRKGTLLTPLRQGFLDSVEGFFTVNASAFGLVRQPGEHGRPASPGQGAQV